MEYRYRLITENKLNAYILDTYSNKIIALCTTKRPDLEFNDLKKMIEKANKFKSLSSMLDVADGVIGELLETNKNRKQKFELGDTVYMIDEDFKFFESKVYRIELDNSKYYYTTNDCDFEDGDIGKWVFKSKMERESRLAALI